MVCLSEINQLEVEAEGASQLIRARQIVGMIVYANQRLLKLLSTSGRIPTGVGLSASNRSAAKLFDRVVKGLSGLLLQNLAKKHAQRTDIPPQRSFFELTC